MKDGLSEEHLDQLLLAIEQREMRSLRWGATGAALFEDELITLAASSVDGDPGEAAGELLDRRLLFQVRARGGGVRYRSRFAEGVRLLASLRQIFPGRHWEAAPHLIADFRADLRERQFPRRDQPGSEVVERLRSRFELGALDIEIASALLSGRTLAAFQERAAEALLREGAADRGVVIAAGTGAGKTLAYYLPAIVQVVREIGRSEFWTKAISVYPRNELLKDQFAEVLRYIRRVRDLPGRPVRIGTFFGPTPFEATSESVSQSWTRFPTRGAVVGYLCPFATCPECEARLIWRLADIELNREKLTCERALGPSQECGFSTDPEQVVLTRRALGAAPPDLLFTTAEMLNRRMSDPNSRGVFGLGQPRGRRPLLMLLDEVHTYEGMTGAQAAMVFRRWRHGVGSPVRWAGLSATLRGAPAFFSQLTGVLESAVEEVGPEADEYERRAAEYQLILRGDPVSQTSLLSASIQSSFLLARLLDPDSAPSRGRAGHRAFVFTDDLDVTNRLFHDLRDAERQGLARERAPSKVHGELAFAAGQEWRSIEEIGWDLGLPLDVSRTSSQDAGVSMASQLVVATASLEVGFDDDRVGAVIQHKSPYRASSFVQRKGRAGRTRQMRPWMVTVLSDYGRDRSTYQSYERLFDPIVEPQQLPIANGYVRRIHAGFAFIDWLATRCASKGWWWWTLSQPSRGKDSAQQKELAEVLGRLLNRDRGELGALTRHLRGALQLDDDEIEAVLWQPPRSLMLELLPTLARRLATDWRTADPQISLGTLDAVSDSPYPLPLPEFLPPNLFSDLNLPEVSIRGEEIDAEASLLVEQALRHLPPGRVTRRFAPGYQGTHHWVPVPVDGSDRYELPLDEFVPRAHPVARVTVDVDGSPTDLTVYRPWDISLSVAPTPRGPQGGGDVLPSSNARYRWHSQIMPQGAPLSIEAAHDPVWSRHIDRLEFYLHDQRTPLTVRRFAAEVDAEVRLRRRGAGGNAEADHRLRVLLRDPGDHGRPAAVGYEAEVDGIAVRFRGFERNVLAQRAEESPSLPTWRTAYVRHLVNSDEELPASITTFLRDWLFELHLAAIVETALDLDIHPSAANELLGSAIDAGRYERLLSGLVRTDQYHEHPEDGSPDPNASEGGYDSADEVTGGTAASERRLRDDLLALIEDEAIRSRLRILFAECWTPNPERWRHWLASALHLTLSEAARAAALSTAPDHVTDDSVRLDLGREGSFSPDQPGEAWLSESAIGGTGVVAAIASAYASEPRAFFRALEFQLLPGEFELSASDLDETVRLATDDERVRGVLNAARDTESHDGRDRRMSELAATLRSHGIAVGHAYLAALNQRVLRPGAPDDTYRLLHDLVSFWRGLEERCGVAIDLRIFSNVAVHATQLGPSLNGDALRQFLRERAGAQLDVADLTSVLAGLLWPRPHEFRRRGLLSWSPFRAAEFADPALVRELLLLDDLPEVAFSDPNWRTKFRALISKAGVVRVRARGDESGELQTALFRLVAEPLDVDFLQLYPAIEQIRRDGREFVATVVLRGKI